MIEFGASTEKFERAQARVTAAEEKLESLQKKQTAERIKEINQLDSLTSKIEADRAKSDALEAQADNASVARKEKIIEKLKEIGAKIEANEEAYARLSKQSKTNEIARLGEIKKANREISNLQKNADKFNSGGLNLGALKGVAALGAGISIGAFKEVIDTLDELGKRARDIGITASQLQELQHQAKLAGISTGELDVSMRSFNRNVSLAAMGTGEARKALDSMGISLTESNGETKTQSELLQEVSTYFAQNAGDAENAGRAARLFGERGAEMLRIFEQGENSVNKIFDAKGIDEAAESAERFNRHVEKGKNLLFKGIVKVVDGWGKIFDFGEAAWDAITGKGFGASELKRIEDEANRENDIRLQKIANEEAQRKSYILKTINEANEKFFTTTQRTKALEEQREIVIEKLKAAKEELNKLDKRSVEYANAYAAAAKLKGEYIKINTRLAKKEADEQEKAEKKLAKIELQRQQKRVAEVKKQIDTKKNQQESRSDFELQTKIQILQAQGKTREAEALKFAKARNELMEKYGYSLKQAEQVQRTLNELEKTKGKEDNTYSDEMKERAKKVLARGEGGSVGKQTLADAQAVLDGKTPEGGFKTAMFQKLDEDSKKDAKKKSKTATLKGGDFGLKGGQFALKELNVDAKASKENLDNEAQTIEEKNSQSLDSLVQGMESLNETIKALKRTVDGIAIKKGAA